MPGLSTAAQEHPSYRNGRRGVEAAERQLTCHEACAERVSHAPMAHETSAKPPWIRSPGRLPGQGNHTDISQPVDLRAGPSWLGFMRFDAF